jgi:glycosidase
MRDYFGQQHVWDHDRPEVHDIIRGWRGLLDHHGERMMVGEVYLMEPAKVAAYHGAALDELQLAFNFAFQWTPWDAGMFRQRVEEVERLWPAGAQPTYVLSSHDAPRHASRFDDPVHGDARARVAALMLLTLRGTPFLYYGEELGLRDGEIPPERICDPVGKRFPSLGRDPERTPMPWDASPNAGFSPEDPWLPLAAGWPTVNVAAQIDDPDSMLSFYRRVLWWRKSAPAILDGGLRVLDAPEGTFVYAREGGGQQLIVALNFADRPAQVALPSAGRVVMATGTTAALEGGVLNLGPTEGAVVEP